MKSFLKLFGTIFANRNYLISYKVIDADGFSDSVKEM